ncbi:MAG: enoyl-CoA hydratase-related protein [Pseudomonadota bacterium]
MAAEMIETGTDHLLASMDDGVLTLTMNRPEARNALTPEMLDAFSEQTAYAESSFDVRCVVVTGAGKGFCAGGDVKAMAQRNKDGRKITIDEAINRQRIHQRATSGRLYKMPKPTIAVLPGAAAGAGLGIALACDLRIMASNAIMTSAFARIGFSGDYGGSLFLSQLVGTSKAKELYFLSERISADEALRLGLTNWVVEPEDLAAKTQEIAGRLGNGPTVAYMYMKENFARALTSGDVHDCLDLEVSHHVHCASTEDHKSAVKAFVEKREPEFKGR